MAMTDRELLELVVAKIDGIDVKVESLDAKVEGLGTKVESLDAKVEKLGTKVESLDAKVEKLEREVKDIQLTLENVINENIRFVAESHLSLNQKLDESLKVNHQKEMLLIRVNRLENEVRRLKERIEAR